MIDIITVLPYELDYPIFRTVIQRWFKFYPDVFRNIYICLTPDHVTGTDLTTKIKERWGIEKWINFVSYPDIPNVDWRHQATSLCLNESSASKVLFMEPDFLLQSNFWMMDYQAHDVVGFEENGRLHPGFLLLSRSLLNQTCLDFGAEPPEFDHFDKVTKELRVLASDIFILPPFMYYHLAGLTHNYRLLCSGGTPNHNPNEFQIYKLIADTLA